jgi:hypothetical protein
VNIAELYKKGEMLVSSNSTALLTGVGVIGTVSTAVLTGRASIRAYAIIENDLVAQDISAGPVTRREIIAACWPEFLPPVGVGALTITAIIMANRLSSKEAAALATAYSLSEKAFTEYKEKVTERLGEGKEQKIRDEVVADRLAANPVNQREVIIAGSGEVLCYDMFTGRYFQSTVEEIKKAENKVNFEILHHMYASLSSFYDEIGLPSTEMSDRLGFNTDNRLEVKFSTHMSSDQRPCVAIDFHAPPVHDYGRMF